MAHPSKTQWVHEQLPLPRLHVDVDHPIIQMVFDVKSPLVRPLQRPASLFRHDVLGQSFVLLEGIEYFRKHSCLDRAHMTGKPLQHLGLLVPAH